MGKMVGTGDGGCVGSAGVGGVVGGGGGGGVHVAACIMFVIYSGMYLVIGPSYTVYIISAVSVSCAHQRGCMIIPLVSACSFQLT